MYMQRICICICVQKVVHNFLHGEGFGIMAKLPKPMTGTSQLTAVALLCGTPNSKSTLLELSALKTKQLLHRYLDPYTEPVPNFLPVTVLLIQLLYVRIPISGLVAGISIEP